MEQLIKIEEKDGRQLVSARELHIFLEVKTQLTDWCIRMFDYQFTPNHDYSEVILKNEYNLNGGRSTLLDYDLIINSKITHCLKRTFMENVGKILVAQKRATNNPVNNFVAALSVFLAKFSQHYP